MGQEQSNTPVQYMFYGMRSQDAKHLDATLNADYSFEFWKPKISEMAPKAMPKKSFLLWSIMHYLRILKNSNYGIFVIYHGDEVAHYSVVLPKYFRTPFMAKNDLQIGPCWTHNEHRRKGLAFYAIQEILSEHRDRVHTYWYLVREANAASRRLAEKAGFALYGKGVRKKKFKVKAIGGFVIEQKYVQ